MVLWIHVVVILRLAKCRGWACLISRRICHDGRGWLESFTYWRHYWLFWKHGIFFIVVHRKIRLVDKRLLRFHASSCPFRPLVFIRIVWSSWIHYHFFVILGFQGDCLTWMFARNMLDELIFSVIFYAAQFACVRLIIRVPSLMILTIPNGSKALRAKSTVIRFLPCVCPHMHEKISFFGKYLSAVWHIALE